MILATASDMKEMDRKTIQHIPSTQLMKQAAQSVYDVILKRIDKKSRILIVCGNGNNGGDGYALALLAYKDYHIEVVADKKPYSEDALHFYHQVKTTEILIHGDIPNLDSYDVIVDAMFGTGLNKEIKEPYTRWIQKINIADKFNIAIDIPSGVYSDTGKVCKDTIKADLVVSFQYPKRGMYFYPGYMYCKEIVTTSIGIKLEDQIIEEPIHVLDNEIIKEFLPKRIAHSHKGTYGKVLMIGGSSSMHGAITMAADACLHSGIGTLTIMVPETLREIVSMKLMEAMILSAPAKNGYFAQDAITLLKEHIKNYDVVMIGCGMGRNKISEELVKVVLSSDKPCVIDADGLFVLAKFPQYLQRFAPVILTPHLKEFSYISNVSLEKIQEDTFQEATMFLQSYPNVTLVLKDERTMIFHQGNIYLNIQGNNALAKGGSGDVLCGLITGMFAQGKDSLKAACCGVYVHGKCAQLLAETHSLYTILPHDLYSVFDKVLLSLINEKGTRK